MKEVRQLTIPKGVLASDDAASKIRKELAEKMRQGKPIEIGGPDGDLPNQGGSPLTVQPGKLASNDDAASKIRKELAEKMIQGDWWSRWRLTESRWKSINSTARQTCCPTVV